MEKMRIIIFGMGVIYKRYISILKENCSVVAVIDNNNELNQVLKNSDGFYVFNPAKIKDLEYDWVVITSTFLFDMRQQLEDLKVSGDKIISIERFISYLRRGQIEEVVADNNNIVNHKKLIILTNSLKLNGGSLASIYAAYALNGMKYDVTVGAPEIIPEIRKDLISRGISIVTIPGIFYPGEREKKYIQKFDFAIVNVYINLPILACIAGNVKCIWWIHECYSLIKQFYSEYKYINSEFLNKIDIFAVSSVAKRNFLKCYPDLNIRILTCGLPDVYSKKIKCNDNSHNEVVFAVIGGIIPVKGQDIMIDAIRIFNSVTHVKTRFLFIGDIPDSSFSRKVQLNAKSVCNIEFVGPLSRSQMISKYADIDVVVSSSREECLPFVIVEGMMLEKICIVPDKAGVSDYIKNGNDGFIYKTGDSMELARCLNYVSENYYKIQSIRYNARKTYLKVFSMRSFSNNLKGIIGDNFDS